MTYDSDAVDSSPRPSEDVEPDEAAARPDLPVPPPPPQPSGDDSR